MKDALRPAALLLAVTVLAVACGTMQPAGMQPQPRSAGTTAQVGAYAPDRLLVKFRPGTSPDRVAALVAQVRGQVLSVIPKIEVYVLRVPSGSVQAAVSSLQQEPAVEFAEPDGYVYAQVIPNDPEWPNLWGLQKVQAPSAWDITTGSNTVRIAVLDTGISSSHPDVGPRVVAAQNFTDSPTPEDIRGHGTHVAGTIGAVTNNSLGVAGMDWNARLMNGKVLGDDGSGRWSWVAAGIVWAADNGAKVINMSLSGPSPSSTLEAAVNYAWSQGVVLACAAGNSNTSEPHYPAYYQNCIAVGATTQTDGKASFSNYGSWVDVGAPGVQILSTVPGGSYAYYQGTSMATPHVAGLAGLLWTVKSTNAEVRACIENNTDPVVGNPFGGGRINALRAVQCSGRLRTRPSPTPSPSPSPTPTPTPTPEPTPSPTPRPRTR